MGFLGILGIVNHVVVEERLATVSPGESLSADVVVLVEGAFGRSVVVVMVLVNHVIVVMFFNTVDVDSQNNCYGQKQR